GPLLAYRCRVAGFALRRFGPAGQPALIAPLDAYGALAAAGRAAGRAALTGVDDALALDTHLASDASLAVIAGAPTGSRRLLGKFDASSAHAATGAGVAWGGIRSGRGTDCTAARARARGATGPPAPVGTRAFTAV